MSKLITPSSDNTLPLLDRQGSCYLVSDTAAGDVRSPVDGASALRTIGRPDSLTAQRVEVGLVLHAMLGLSAATEYFAKHDVCQEIAARVLNPNGRRRGTHDVNGIRT